MTQQFKAGDKVRVVVPFGSLVKDDVHTVDRSDGTFVYLAPYNPYVGWNPERFELVEPAKVEIGDTVEVTNTEGTTVRGVVRAVGALGGLTFAGAGDIFVPVSSTTSVTIIEKVKKPKVWAVGDVMEGGDYESETIPNGTVVKAYGPGMVRVGGQWVDLSDGVQFASASLHAPRTIAYVPEVSA